MSPTGEDTTRLGTWLPGLTAVLAFLVFLPALQARFVNWDDEASFLTNTAYRGFGWAQLQRMFSATLLGHWSPLTWMTWSLNYVVVGLDPWGYHLGNLLLHAANVALLWLVARRLLAIGTGAPITSLTIASGATIAAPVWGLHPLRALRRSLGRAHGETCYARSSICWRYSRICVGSRREEASSVGGWVSPSEPSPPRSRERRPPHGTSHDSIVREFPHRE